MSGSLQTQYPQNTLSDTSHCSDGGWGNENGLLSVKTIEPLGVPIVQLLRPIASDITQTTAMTKVIMNLVLLLSRVESG